MMTHPIAMRFGQLQVIPSPHYGLSEDTAKSLHTTLLSQPGMPQLVRLAAVQNEDVFVATTAHCNNNQEYKHTTFSVKWGDIPLYSEGNHDLTRQPNGKTLSELAKRLAYGASRALRTI